MDPPAPENRNNPLAVAAAAQSSSSSTTTTTTTTAAIDPPAPFHPTATRRVRQTVRVGVGVVVKAPGTTNCVYAGIRKGSHGAGSLALPGGHLEMYESWEQCAIREIKEEMDIDLIDVQFGHVTNDIMSNENKHYVTIFMMGKPNIETSELPPKNMEIHKCEGWNVYSWDELKQKLQNSMTDDQDKDKEEEEAQMTNENNNRLFGPLLKLVQDQPPAVLNYLQQE